MEKDLGRRKGGKRERRWQDGIGTTMAGANGEKATTYVHVPRDLPIRSRSPKLCWRLAWVRMQAGTAGRRAAASSQSLCSSPARNPQLQHVTLDHAAHGEWPAQAWQAWQAVQVAPPTVRQVASASRIRGPRSVEPLDYQWLPLATTGYHLTRPATGCRSPSWRVRASRSHAGSQARICPAPLLHFYYVLPGSRLPRYLLRVRDCPRSFKAPSRNPLRFGRADNTSTSPHLPNPILTSTSTLFFSTYRNNI